MLRLGFPLILVVSGSRFSRARAVKQRWTNAEFRCYLGRTPAAAAPEFERLLLVLIANLTVAKSHLARRPRVKPRGEDLVVRKHQYRLSATPFTLGLNRGV